MPRLVVPSRKVTVPVGVAVPDNEVTVAVRVTFCPAITAFAEMVNAV